MRSIFKFLGHGSARTRPTRLAARVAARVAGAVDTDFSFYLLFPFYLCDLCSSVSKLIFNGACNFFNYARNCT